MAVQDAKALVGQSVSSSYFQLEYESGLCFDAYIHAWGTEYNGFLLFESDSADSFLDWWSRFKDTIRWYVEQTHTIAARRR